MRAFRMSLRAYHQIRPVRKNPSTPVLQLLCLFRFVHCVDQHRKPRLLTIGDQVFARKERLTLMLTAL